MNLRRKTLKLMGSHIDILIFDSIDAENILDDAVEMLKMYEHRFSANDDSSELMVVNHNAGIKAVKVHPDLFDLIKIGKLHSCAPNSFLNIAIGPIVQTWRIGFNDVKVPPRLINPASTPLFFKYSIIKSAIYPFATAPKLIAIPFLAR